MKKLLFIFAAAIMCLLSSCSDFKASKTCFVSLEKTVKVNYMLSYKGKDLTTVEQKKVKEHMLSIAERNLSADDAKKELQELFTKDLNRSALSLIYVLRSEYNDGHHSSYASYNWTFLQWCGYIIIAVILFCIAKGVIKHRLHNRRFKRLPNKLDAGD